MLLSLKKSSEKAEARQALAWHPSFTDPSKLPDVKVVRTKFFVNSASVVMLGAILCFVGNREYAVYQINNDLNVIESDIRTTKPNSDRAVATFNKFKAEEKKLAEVVNLSAESLVFSDYLIHLGATLPERVTLQRIIHRGPGQPMSLTLAVDGLDAASGDIASKYVKQLQDDKVSKEYFNDVTLTNTVRNVGPKNLTLEISMAVKPPKK